MISRIKGHWENVTDSLWFVPGICILAITALAVLVPEIDRDRHYGFLFPGDAGAARAILQVVAGSLITVISLVFSITILVLQQASQQYTPRLIGNFMAFRGVQIVLGFFLGTFVYALLVLRFVQQAEDGTPEYVPEISVIGAILLAVICIGMLVYFIHHTAVSIEVPAVARRIGSQVQDAIGHQYPGSGEPVDGPDDLHSFRKRHPNSVPVEVRAIDSGHVRRIDEQLILDAVEHAEWLAIRVTVGVYVHRGDLLFEVGGLDGLDDSRVEKLREAVSIDIERSLHQDPLFGIRQLVDIALRALSPSLNDPTTAEYMLSQLGDVLVELALQPETSRIRRASTGSCVLELWADRKTFDDYVDASFSQIRRMIEDEPHVLLHMLKVIESVGYNISDESRLAPLRHQIAEVLVALDSSGLSGTDREVVRDRARELLTGLDSPHDRVVASTERA